jgi:hypothetical protein
MERCDDNVLKRSAVVYLSIISQLKPTKIRRIVFDHSMKELWQEEIETGEHLYLT